MSIYGIVTENLIYTLFFFEFKEANPGTNLVFHFLCIEIMKFGYMTEKEI